MPHRAHVFETERLPFVQQMILAKSEEERKAALAQLLPYQRADFDGLFRAMDGLPVIIRLIDPPMHEFLPSHDGLLRAVAVLEVQIEDRQKIIQEMADKVEQRRRMMESIEPCVKRQAKKRLRFCQVVRNNCETSPMKKRLHDDQREVDSLKMELQQKQKMLGAVESMREANPMLGLRGVRLRIQLHPASLAADHFQGSASR